MKKNIFIFLLYLCLTNFCLPSTAQNVTITPNGITPALSNNYPRLSYNAILALANPQVGDIAYDTTFLCLRVYNGAKWLCTFQDPSNPTPNITALRTSNNISGYDVCVDTSGNVYVSGTFRGTVDFGGITKTSEGSSNTFIAKYSNNGNAMWVETIAKNNITNDILSYTTGLKILLDSTNNIFVTGSFVGIINFSGSIKMDAGAGDIFVAKYTNNGTLQWIQTAGGTADDRGRDIAIDKNGNIYITGSFSSTFTFGNTVVTSFGREDIFLAKYNSNGVFQWVKTAGGTSQDSGVAVVVDAFHVYIACDYYGTANIGNTSVSSITNSPFFLAKYNNNGDFLSVLKAGSSEYKYLKSMTMDVEGNIYITGGFSGTIAFEYAAYLNKASAGSTDIFIVKFAPSVIGGNWVWVKTAGGDYLDVPADIVADIDNNIYVTGYYSSMSTFGSSIKSAIGEEDIFVAKYDKNGAFKWVQTTGGITRDWGSKLTVDSNGNVFVIGDFGGPASFGNVVKSSGGFFLARLQE